jgi:hypothetical protein
MKTIIFTNTVSSMSGNYCSGQTYTVSDEVAADMVKAGHAKEVAPCAPAK